MIILIEGDIKMQKYVLKREDVRFCKAKGYNIIKCDGKAFIVDYYSGYSKNKIKFNKFLPTLVGMELNHESYLKVSKISKSLASKSLVNAVGLIGIGVARLSNREPMFMKLIIDTNIYISIVISIFVVVVVYLITEAKNKKRLNKMIKELGEDINYDKKLIFTANEKGFKSGKSAVLIRNIFIIVVYRISYMLFFDFDNYSGLLLIALATYMLLNPIFSVPASMNVTVERIKD